MKSARQKKVDVPLADGGFTDEMTRVFSRGRFSDAAVRRMNYSVCLSRGDDIRSHVVPAPPADSEDPSAEPPPRVGLPELN